MHQQMRERNYLKPFNIPFSFFALIYILRIILCNAAVNNFGHRDLIKNKLQNDRNGGAFITVNSGLFQQCATLDAHNQKFFSALENRWYNMNTLAKPLPNYRKQNSSILSFASTNDADNSSSDIENEKNMEEILLMIKLSPFSPNDSSFDENSDFNSKIEKMRAYLRSFPFAAVLPVQPLQYLPSENGVSVTFLRKKTKEKGSFDGGIQIDVEESVTDDNKDATNGNQQSIFLMARRNSEGQTIGKIFSEKIVVLALVDGISGAQTELGVQVQSIYHKWME